MSTCEADRNLANFKRDLSGNRFTSFSLDTELLANYENEVDKLKEEVKKELVATGVKTSEKMILINTLERLGIFYLFTKEIEEQLEQIFANYKEMNIDYDLWTTALHFRIFRQHGYNVSSDVFKKFKDNSGTFKESLKNDLSGILNLYEAAYMMVNGEEILVDALSFTKAHLKSIAPTLSLSMAAQVNHALEQSLHRSFTRIEARKYISFYEIDDSRNEKILRLAKVDFNRLQLLHKEELFRLSNWWENLNLETPYSRDRIVECFVWAIAVHFEPEYSMVRVSLAKIIAWLVLVDDSYDAFSKHDELTTFNEAIQRWDRRAVDQIPQYMKPVFNEIFNYHDEWEKELEKDRTSYALHYSIEGFKEIVEAYELEAEWVKKGYMPSFDDYMACRLKSSVGILVIVSFLGTGELAPLEAFEWISNENEMVKACRAIGRITNDIAGYKFERQREHTATAIECYMKQYNVTEEEALVELYRMVDKLWFTMNEEVLRTTVVSKPFLVKIINNARVCTEFYKAYDRFTEPEGLKDHVISLLIDPVPI